MEIRDYLIDELFGMIIDTYRTKCNIHLEIKSHRDPLAIGVTNYTKFYRNKNLLGRIYRSTNDGIQYISISENTGHNTGIGATIKILHPMVGTEYKLGDKLIKFDICTPYFKLQTIIEAISQDFFGARRKEMDRIFKKFRNQR